MKALERHFDSIRHIYDVQQDIVKGLKTELDEAHNEIENLRNEVNHLNNQLIASHRELSTRAN